MSSWKTQFVAIAALIATALPTVGQEPTRTVTVYRYPDGRVARVVIEESPAVVIPAPQVVHRPCEVAPPRAACPKCGPACDCPSCTCDRTSYDARCGAAPKVMASGPPAPPVILPAAPQPPVYYVPPVQYVQPMPRAPLFQGGVQFRGPLGGGVSGGICIGGR